LVEHASVKLLMGANKVWWACGVVPIIWHDILLFNIVAVVCYLIQGIQGKVCWCL